MTGGSRGPHEAADEITRRVPEIRSAAAETSPVPVACVTVVQTVGPKSPLGRGWCQWWW